MHLLALKVHIIGLSNIMSVKGSNKLNQTFWRVLVKNRVEFQDTIKTILTVHKKFPASFLYFWNFWNLDSANEKFSFVSHFWD